MALLPQNSIRDRGDIARFEAEMPLARRLPERSILDVFEGTAARLPGPTPACRRASPRTARS